MATQYQFTAATELVKAILQAQPGLIAPIAGANANDGERLGGFIAALHQECVKLLEKKNELAG